MSNSDSYLYFINETPTYGGRKSWLQVRPNKNQQAINKIKLAKTPTKQQYKGLPTTQPTQPQSNKDLKPPAR